MKRNIRKIFIIAIPLLLLALGAWIVGGGHNIDPGKTKNPVIEVSKYGTLTNLKDEKGKPLFTTPIQEGYYVRFRVGDGKEHILYAIGDRISYPNVSSSGYQEKLPGAGITTQNGLNVTSGFVFDKQKMTLKVIRTIVNLSKENATMHLSEVKNYCDAALLALRTEIDAAKKVLPLPTGPDNIGTEKIALSLPAGPNATGTPIIEGITNSNCWPCQPWPDCDLGTPTLDPLKATVICINCDKAASGVVHVVCLADLESARKKYKEEGCEHQIAYTGIDASGGKALSDVDCSAPQASVKPLSGEGTPTISIEQAELDMKRLLTLQAGAAIILRTEYKVNLPIK